MICPNCKAEYRQGYTVCAECQVPLVDKLPESEEEAEAEPELEPVTILETGDPADILVAKSLLEDAGIEYFPRGEGVQDLFGVGRMGSGFNTLAGPVEIQVRPEDADEARRLLARLDEPRGKVEEDEEEPEGEDEVQ